MKIKPLNRITSFALTILLLFGLLYIPIYGDNNTMNMSIVFTDTNYQPIEYAKVGDTIYMGVKLDNYQPLVAYNWRIDYDPNQLEFGSGYNKFNETSYAQEFSDGVYIGSAIAPSNKNVSNGVAIVNMAKTTNVTMIAPNGIAYYLAFSVIKTGEIKASFNHESLDNFIWRTAAVDNSSNYTDIITTETNGSLLSVTTGVFLNTTSVTVDGTKGANITPMAFDSDVNEIENSILTWSVSGDEDSGVTINAATGEITVAKNAKSGTYTVTAEGSDNIFGDSNSSTAQFTVSRAPSVAQSINVSGEIGAIEIPADNALDVTRQFSATITDQYGESMSATDVKWTVSPATAGISISDSGLLTVKNEAKGSITDESGATLTVKAESGTQSGETTVTVKRAASEAASIAFCKDGSAITSDTIAVPQNGSVEATYTAQVLDQYGEVMSGKTAIWSEPIGLPTNVTFDATSGKLTVPARENTGTGNVTLTASCDSASGSVSINVAKIGFTVAEGAVTTASNPVYGMTWGDIVKVTGAITASVGGQTVTGQYSVQNANYVPEAGNNKAFTIVFTSDDGTYNGVPAYNGYVDIAKKSVSVTGISVSDKEYDGTNTATVDVSETAAVDSDDIVDGDDVTVISATGTFADKNVGDGKTVNIQVVLGGQDAANYVVNSYTDSADITPKTLTNISFNDGAAVTKEYDATTAAGKFSGTVSFNGKVGDENVSIDVTPGAYADANVATGKTVTLTLSLSGTDAGNYKLATNSVEFTGAEITAKDISGTQDLNQNVVVGVGTFTDPSFTVIDGEEVTGGFSYTYNGITDKTAIEDALSKLNADQTADINYTFTADGNYKGEITGTINVTMVDILFTVDGETANAKNALDIDTNAVYGETWADIVTIKSGINATLNGKPVEGTYQLSVNTTDRPTAGNHSFELQFVSGGKIYKVCDATVNVAKREVSISGGLSVTSKQYDGTANATVTGTAALSNVFGTDDVGLTYTGGTFESRNAGTHNVTLIDATLIGDDKDNYTLSNNYTLTGTIDKRPVTVTGGLSVTGKEYDGTTRADIVNSATFDNVVTGESLTLTFTGANFASADVGTHDVTLTGVALGGDYAANYELTGNLPALSGTISKATYSPDPSLNINIVTNQAAAQTGTLTALNFFGGSMPADATITAVDPTKGTVISGIYAANGTLTYTSAANITTEGTTETYNVTITTKNYKDITAVLTFTTVDKTPVTISGVSVANKVYNGQEAAYTGTAVASVDGKAVEVSGFTFTWKDSDGKVLGSAPVNAGSYTLEIAVADSDPKYVGTAPAINFAITPATVTITVDDKSAFVGEDMPEFTYTVSGLAAGESLAANPTITCNADMDEQGEYAITAAGAAVPATGNYNSEIVYVNGILTVSRRPVNVGPTYDIEIANPENGSVDASLSNASEGSVITLTVTPDDGYKLGSITVTDENGDEVSVRRSGNSYRFTMPDSAVRVSARFVRDTGALPFNDVNTGDWFYDYVEYVYENGIMDGVDSGVFSPNTATTRGMVVTILYRLAGEPTVRGGNVFADVAENTWYTDPVAWASNAGIVNGTSATTFSPDAPVTREQFAAMLYRYMDYTGEDVSASASMSRYADASSVSPYAEGAMSWAVAEGIINGRTATTLEPAGNCTRAEVAAMIARVFG